MRKQCPYNMRDTELQPGGAGGSSEQEIGRQKECWLSAQAPAAAWTC